MTQMATFLSSLNYVEIKEQNGPGKSAESQSHSASNMKAMNLIRHEMRQLPDKTRSKIFYIFLRKKALTNDRK